MVGKSMVKLQLERISQTRLTNSTNESEFNNRLEYGKEILKGLSDELTKYLGKGYSVSNLKYMRMFYKAYPNFDAISPNLSWSHYLELMKQKKY